MGERHPDAERHHAAFHLRRALPGELSLAAPHAGAGRPDRHWYARRRGLLAPATGCPPARGHGASGDHGPRRARELGQGRLAAYSRTRRAEGAGQRAGTWLPTAIVVWWRAQGASVPIAACDAGATRGCP